MDNAKEQGRRVPYQQSNGAEKQGGGISFDWAKQERVPYYFPYMTRPSSKYPYQQENTAKQQRNSFWLPRKNAEEQGISFHLPHQQGFVAPYAKEQGFRINWSPNKMADQEGFRVYLPTTKQHTAKEQGIRVSLGWPQAQGRIIPYYNGYEQDYKFTFPVEQGVAEKQGFSRMLDVSCPISTKV